MHRRLRVLRYWIATSCLVFGLLLGLSIAPSVFAAETYYAPKLNVQIPGLKFSDYPIVRSLHTISVPFLSAYVGAAYAYLVGISVIAASIMIVFGGFKYILSSSGLEVSDAKRTIADALIGLFLILGSYTILSVLNTSQVTFQPLTLYSVEGDPWINGMIVNSGQSTENTNPSPDPSPFTSGSCPFNLPTDPAKSNAIDGKKSLAFHAATLPLLTGTYADRIKKAGDLSVSCKMIFGPCGTDAKTIMTLAGFADPKCLTSDNGACDPKMADRKILKGGPQIPVEQAKLFGLRAGHDCAKPRKPPVPAFEAKANAPGLSQGEAMDQARSMFSGIAGYPDTYADQLQPGDWIMYYIGNTDCAGSHSALFMGWSNTPGKANILNGSMQVQINYKEVCLKTACGRWAPLLVVNRPDQEQLRK